KSEDAANKVISLLESLHVKLDGMPKCECNALRQEVSDLKGMLAKALNQQAPPPPSSSPSSTYTAVKQALNDAATYADKASRAVWVGRKEGASPTETAEADQKAVEELVSELNIPELTQALASGDIKHHRHPQVKGDRKNRIMKISMPSQKVRDTFLSAVRSARPNAVTKISGNYIRRDLCPYELELEKKARIEAYKLNCEKDGLYYGVRDEKLYKFGGNPRPLPDGYKNRPPRGYVPSQNEKTNEANPAINFKTNEDTSANKSILSGIPPMPSTGIANANGTSLGYNLILLSETWLREDESDAYLLCSNDDYVVFRKDRPSTAEKSRGGGVAILSSPLLNPFLVNTFSCEGIESVIIDIHHTSNCINTPFKSVRICMVYRSPSCASTSLESFLSFITPFIIDTPFLMCGDLNLPTIDWVNFSAPSQNDFLSFASNFRMTQFVNFKTRGKNILDLVLCNHNIVFNVNPALPFADHTSIAFSLGVPPPPTREFTPSRKYHLADRDSINHLISSHDWTIALSALDADQAYTYFSDFMNYTLDNFVPKSSPSPISAYPPYLRNLHFKSDRATSLAPNSVLAKKLATRFEKALRAHYVRVESRVIESKNPKAYYSLCKTRLKSSNSAPPGIIDVDGTKLLTNLDKAQAFSKYFASYFINGIPLSVSPSMKDFGILMQPSLKFNDHVTKIISKARAQVNIMFKCFYSTDHCLYNRAFVTFVRPLLEYCSVVWSPTTVTLANSIESVQRNFTRRLFARCNIPYTCYPQRISLLSLQTLEHRRFLSDLLFLHKSIHGFYSYDHSSLYIISPLTRNLRRAHSLRVSLPFASPKSHSSFVTRTIDRWNVFSNQIVTSSPKHFRSHLLSLPSISFTSDSLLRV
ncbi:hypothetical protein PMAYCL1PPCAC_10462, partial [Pristionchus mayeri]